jgi:hypothetical protein
MKKGKLGQKTSPYGLFGWWKYYIFPAFVTEGRVSRNLRLAVWTCLESKSLCSDVLVHTLGKFRVTEQSSLWLTGQQRERVVCEDRLLCKHTLSSHTITSEHSSDPNPRPTCSFRVLASLV